MGRAPTRRNAPARDPAGMSLGYLFLLANRARLERAVAARAVERPADAARRRSDKEAQREQRAAAADPRKKK